MRPSSFVRLVTVLFAPVGLLAVERPLSEFQDLVREESWMEKWQGADGQVENRTVTAGLWTQAMQASLDAQNTLHIPARPEPYYLDGPLVLKSGQKLNADAGAEIRLKPGSNTCMVRNAHLVGSADRPVPEDTNPDIDIVIEGGIWTTLANGVPGANGNPRGASARKNPVPGTHGVFLLHNVRHVVIRNVTIRQSKAFAVHLANARGFLVDGVRLERHGRDGVHVNGPASDGVIRGVSGESDDDTVALNAWEWQNYAPSFGPIHHVEIERVSGAAAGQLSADSIRLLPGVKRFSDGSTLDCPIHDIRIHDITDIREFKFYDQPNLELGRERDFSAGVGSLRNIRLEHLIFNRPGTIEVHANTDGLTLRNVALNFPTRTDTPLLLIGPKSQTYRGGPSTDPSRWVEIFSPDLDCTVRNLEVAEVHRGDSPGALPFDQVVRVVQQKLNPDYPRTTPRGGTGKGILVR